MLHEVHPDRELTLKTLSIKPQVFGKCNNGVTALFTKSLA